MTDFKKNYPNLLFRPPVFRAPVDAVSENQTERKSYLGTPVISNIEIQSGKYTTIDGKTIEFDGIRIDSVLIQVSQSKNIITTPIQGQNGTVKEYISDGDFFISASGVIIGESSQSGKNFTVKNVDGYPENEVRKFIEICKIPTAIEVISDFLDYFEIRNIVIDSFSLGQQSGDRSGQPFELRMISDTPIELIEI